MAQDDDTGGVLPSFPGHAPTWGRPWGRRWAGHVDPRPVHAGRPPRPEHVRLVGVVLWIASFVWLLAMNVTVRQSEQPTLVLLFYFGFLVALAMADHGLHHPGRPVQPVPAGRRPRSGGARAMDPPPAVAKVPPDTGLMALLHRLRFEQAGLPGGGDPPPGGEDRDHHPRGTDHAATPARTTVRTPDALPALTAVTHGKLPLLLGDDQ
jgi:hypothetical protein